MRDFRDKQVLLTGAVSGIGRALTLQLAQAGARLWLADIDRLGLSGLQEELTKQGTECRTTVCDLTQRAEVHHLADRVLEDWGGVDLLINNAGVAFYGPTHSMTEAQCDRVLNLNLLAPVHLTQRLLPAMLQRSEAHLVNMCSIAGLVPGGRFNAYATSKFGLYGHTQALRAEYGRKGLGVTAICPGPVATPLYARAECNHQQHAPLPPRWVCASPERVAELTLWAIRRNRRQQLVTPLAHLLYQVQSLAPWFLDFLHTFSRRRLPRWLGGKPPKAAEHTKTPPTVAETPVSGAARRIA